MVAFQGFYIEASRQTRPFFLPGHIENNTWVRVDMEFLFECSTRYLMSESSERIRCRARLYKLL